MPSRFGRRFANALTPKRRTVEFTLVAKAPDKYSEVVEKLYEAGCDDATVSLQRGYLLIDFSREAKNTAQALATAIRDVRKAGIKVERVEPDYLVSLADIAKRAGLTRAAVTNYANGQRQCGFPFPIARVTAESALYDWEKVARWLFKKGQLGTIDVVQARLFKVMNLDLEKVSHAENAKS